METTTSMMIRMILWLLYQTCLRSRSLRRTHAFRTLCTLVRVDLSKLRLFGGQVNICESIVLGPV